MGVPVVTLRGDRHAGRVGASLLSQIGLTDWIAGSVEEYVQIAAALAGNPQRLKRPAPHFAAAPGGVAIVRRPCLRPQDRGHLSHYVAALVRNNHRDPGTEQRCLSRPSPEKQRKALRVAPDYADAMFNLALLLQRKSQHAEATQPKHALAYRRHSVGGGTDKTIVRSRCRYRMRGDRCRCRENVHAAHENAG